MVNPLQHHEPVRIAFHQTETADFLLPLAIIPGGGGGYSRKNWVGVCGPIPKSLTLFMTKICAFSYPIYDLTKNLIPYL